MKNNSGITLVTLAVTILIIIILAGITINAVLGDNGLLKQAQDAKDLAESTTQETGEKMNKVLQEYANVMAEDKELEEPDPGTEPEEPVDPPEPEKSGVEQSKEEGTVFQTDTQIKDTNGNIITVPEGFKIASDSGDTVQEGIVIEDVSASGDVNVEGSQYVWVPVGTFKKDNGTEVEIILGRYTFDTAGKPTLQQAAYTNDNLTNYLNEVMIENHYIEISTHRDGVLGFDNGENATAKNLEKFINSCRTKGGYYIGRYEASYASGASSSTSTTNCIGCKAASKKSTAYFSNMAYNAGTLWNNIIQMEASRVAINTYDDTGIGSDLINSYAWDTAIVYIQEATGENYANKTSVNTSLTNTGTIRDEVCKINDMASNLSEWTTEYSNSVQSDTIKPCVFRGDVYLSGIQYNTSYRYSLPQANWAAYSTAFIGFRIILYFL